MNNLNEALFKDLVQSTDFKKNKSVRNPLNIIWMLENTNIVSKQAKEYLDKLKIKQSTFTEKNTRKASSVICKILNNEIVFIKRFDFLLSKIESIQPFAMPIVDLKSISILNHSIDCGLNINVEMNDTYLLKYAIESKNSVISNHLYDLPTIDKLKIDNQGNNLAHLLAIAAKNNV